MNRLSFSVPDKGTDLINDVSLEQIMEKSCRLVEEYLKEFLDPIKAEKEKRIKNYVTNDAPQFRHLLKYMPDEISRIKPNLTDDKLDDELHQIKRKFDKNINADNKKLLEKIEKGFDSEYEYKTLFEKQVCKISEANRADLANYVAHRKIIIDLLQNGIRKTDSDKFNKESYVHNLIYPMRTTSDDIEYEAHNLWLIDEKLAYCSYISSDIPFNNDNKEERTDIMILNNPVAVSEDENDGSEFDTIVLFELKRPMRDDYSIGDNPISQLYNYVEKIKSGNAKDKYGRIIKAGDNTKFYLYAVCDVTSSLERTIRSHNLKHTPDRLGYYTFNDTYNAYVEILSFNKLLNDSKKRNRILFEKLGI